MTKKPPEENHAEKRAETRETLEKIQSVELKLPNLPIYVFKLKDISPSGICFLVKADSDILNHIRQGQILNLKYYTEATAKPSEALTSEIKNITKMDKGPYKEHRLVGLMILEK
jgi:hypothetical protein